MKKKLISILLCAIAVASLAGCGKKVDMDALREEIREEVLAELEEEQKKEEREAEKEARRAEKEKEDEEEPVETDPVETPEVTDTPEQTKTPVAGSTEWQSMTFTLDDKTYTLPFAYEDIKSDWNFDMADYGHENGYILNPDQYVYSTISLEHNTYDCSFYVGLANNSDSAKDITECDIYSVSIDMQWGDSYPDLVLPGNLTWGSTLEEVEAVFGIPEDTYYSENLGYWNYTYSVDYTNEFSLTVYEDKGITEFTLRTDH